ncbi:hypothetical protein D3C73_1610520 [compost metagenome]
MIQPLKHRYIPSKRFESGPLPDERSGDIDLNCSPAFTIINEIGATGEAKAGTGYPFLGRPVVKSL